MGRPFPRYTYGHLASSLNVPEKLTLPDLQTNPAFPQNLVGKLKSRGLTSRDPRFFHVCKAIAPHLFSHITSALSSL